LDLVSTVRLAGGVERLLAGLSPSRAAILQIDGGLAEAAVLVEVGRQETPDLVVTEFFSPCDQGPVAAQFVVLDGLRIGDDGGVQHGFVFDVARGFVRFLDDAVDGRAPGPAGLLAELLENLLKPFDLFVGSSRWFLRPVTRSRLVALSIIFGSALRICCSA
jgi:hypothetical protein